MQGMLSKEIPLCNLPALAVLPPGAARSRKAPNQEIHFSTYRPGENIPDSAPGAVYYITSVLHLTFIGLYTQLTCLSLSPR